MRDCLNANHPKFHSGVVEVCYVCIWRTDDSFALWSRLLLDRVRCLDAQKEVAWGRMFAT